MRCTVSTSSLLVGQHSSNIQRIVQLSTKLGRHVDQYITNIGYLAIIDLAPDGRGSHFTKRPLTDDIARSLGTEYGRAIGLQCMITAVNSYAENCTESYF